MTRSATDGDSVLSALAAAPPRDAPKVQTSAILVTVEDDASGLARAQSVLAGFGLQTESHSDGGFVALTRDVQQAAACALTMREAVPLARIVVTTAPVAKMAIERAVALSKETPTSTIRVDEATAGFLRGRFEIEVDRSGGVLVATRVQADRATSRSGQDAAPAHTGRAWMLKTAFAAIVLIGLSIAVEPWLRGPRERTASAPGVEALRYLHVPGGSATAAEVAAMPEDRFVAVSGHRANFGFTRDTIWVKFSLRNPTARPIDLVLYASRDWVEELDLYEPGIGQLAHSGVRVPLLERPIHTEDIAFPISLAPNQTRTLLLRMNGATPMSFAGDVRERLDFENFEARDELLFGAFYAVMLGLAVYSLILFLTLRDRVQLLVGLTLATYALAEATSHGHVSRLIPAGAGTFEIQGGAVAFSAWLLAGNALLRVTLQLRQWRPLFDRAIMWAGIIAALVALVPVARPQSYHLLFVGITIGIVPIALAFIVCPKTRTAWYYIVATSCHTLPGSLSIAVLNGLVPAYPLTEYSNHVGAVVMSCLYSLLVADAIRQQRTRIRDLNASTLTLNTELAARNEELRFQVAERSRELANVLAKHHGQVAAAAVSPGDTFEQRYRVIREVGQGGYGSVYEVERRSDGRCLALKVLTHSRSGSDAARVAREAEIGARIAHPNVVSIVDVGVARGISPFVVMEFMRGGSLESRRPRFGDVKWALPLLGGIAAGLRALHTAQVVHRDLKPANVLLDDSIAPEVPKVSDFGISAFEGAAQRSPPPDGVAETVDARHASLHLTRADSLIGTPAYMAPETARGARHVTAAADVFAFGLLACEMLTGQHAFEGELPVFAALDGRRYPDARPIRGTAGVPDRLATSLEVCLLEDPLRRPSIQEVMSVLESIA